MINQTKDHYADLKTNIIIINEINISANESIDADLIDKLYNEEMLQTALTETLSYINTCTKDGLVLPYFTDIDNEMWHSRPKALDIYLTDANEGQALNKEARDKDYATNILSYPSEMPANIIELMPTLPLGELIICHEVIAREAAEQNKTLEQHLTHLIIHGVLHLLGFDHELGAAEQDEMERFEIDILAGLNITNPYL